MGIVLKFSSCGDRVFGVHGQIALGLVDLVLDAAQGVLDLDRRIKLKENIGITFVAGTRHLLDPVDAVELVFDFLGNEVFYFRRVCARDRAS